MTLADLWNEEANWCESLRTIFAAGGTGVPTANIEVAQSVSHSRSPRIEIEVEEVGRASDHLAFANDQWYYDHRAATIRVDLVTNRTAAVTQNHGLARGRLRYLMSREAQRLVSPAVTWYTVVDVQELGSNVTVRDPEADREDVTSFRFRIEYGVLPSVVPTV
jgi:hypothetical protein